MNLSIYAINKGIKQMIGVCILAAGKGTRLNQIYSKVLAPLLGKKLIDYPLSKSIHFLKNNNCLDEKSIGIVVGHDKENVESYINSTFESYQDNYFFAHQKTLDGTASAVESYLKSAGSSLKKYTLILCGDVPLLSLEHLEQLFLSVKNEKDLLAVAASFTAKKPFGYGRIQKSDKGFSIIEQKEIDTHENKEELNNINEVNSGIYIVKTDFLREFIESKTHSSTTNEYYLTDLFKKDLNVKTVLYNDEKNFLGVNSMEQLEEAQRIIVSKHIQSLQKKGVLFHNSSTNIVHEEVDIDAGTIIYPGVILEGKCKIGKDVIIESNTVIKNSVVEDQVFIKANCYIDESQISKKSTIGPFAHLRPKSQLKENVKVGNFVEVKKSILMAGSKVSHLSYVGDATIGDNSNIGCGFITCNYDGKNKHQTIIGKNSFIGSDCQAVAPVSIGDNSFIACGSTITNDVEDGGFAIARSKQVTRPGMAKRFLKD